MINAAIGSPLIALLSNTGIVSAVSARKPVSFLPEVPEKTITRKLTAREQKDCQIIGKLFASSVLLFGHRIHQFNRPIDYIEQFVTIPVSISQCTTVLDMQS